MKKITGFAIALALSVGMTLPLAAQENDGRPTRAKLLEKFDKNGDGKLDQAEREAMREALGDNLRRRRGGQNGPIGEGRRGRGGRGAAQADAGGRGARRKAIIEKLDRNGDGQLDQAERRAGKDRFHQRKGQGRRAQDMPRRFDRNADGRVGPLERRLRRHAMMHRLLRERQLRFAR